LGGVSQTRGDVSRNLISIAETQMSATGMGIVP
jgi:hypothetical protein